MNRDDIHLIARNSDWSPDEIAKALKEDVYPKPTEWAVFLRWLSLGLGATMLLAGVIFFFAYNWQNLHKFAKMGLIVAPLVSLVLFAAFSKWDPVVRKTLLTTACIMTGVLFAVFGQVYQTGANAFDFFLAWSVFTLVWVVAARFPILWLLFLILINTTFFLFIQQAAPRHLADFGPQLAVSFNLACFLSMLIFPRFFTGDQGVPAWLSGILAGTVTVLSGVSYAISISMEDHVTQLIASAALVIVTGSVFYRIGIRNRNLLLVAMVGFLILITTHATIHRLLREHYETVILLNTTLTMGALYGMVFYLIRLNKTWKNERERTD